jgi:hypothetical protein
MNVKLMVIGGILLLLLIVLSPNPARDARREREKAMEGKDKLVESIKEHNSGKKRFTWSSLMGSDKTKTDVPVSPGDAPAPASAKTNPFLQQGAGGSTAATGDAAPSSVRPAAVVPRAPEKPPEPEGYYPPPPLNQ